MSSTPPDKNTITCPKLLGYSKKRSLYSLYNPIHIARKTWNSAMAFHQPRIPIVLKCSPYIQKTCSNRSEVLPKHLIQEPRERFKIMKLPKCPASSHFPFQTSRHRLSDSLRPPPSRQTPRQLRQRRLASQIAPSYNANFSKPSSRLIHWADTPA